MCQVIIYTLFRIKQGLSAGPPISIPWSVKENIFRRIFWSTWLSLMHIYRLINSWQGEEMYCMEEKESYCLKVEERLHDLVNQMYEMIWKTNNFARKARKYFKWSTEKFRENQKATNEKINEIRNASGKSWKDLTQGLEKGMRELEKGFENALQEFKKGDSVGGQKTSK